MRTQLPAILLLVCCLHGGFLLAQETISSEPRGSEYERLLVGIEVDGEEVGFGEILRTDNDYLVPMVELFEAMDSRYEIVDDQIEVQTPGGDTEISAALIRIVDGFSFIPLNSLNSALFLEARFDSSSYALVMSLPWRREQGEGESAAPEIEPDFKPPPVSLRQLRLNTSYRDTESTPSVLSHELRGSGALLDGAWFFDLRQQQDEQAAFDEFYWLRSLTHQQWLVGVQTIALSPVATSRETSGVQWLYSNHSIDQNGRRVPTANDFARNLGRSSRDISGTGQPGARALLYIDGHLQRTELIRLDGTYEFPDIELGSRGYREVIVEVQDRSTGSVLSRQNFSQNFSSMSFEKGQYVAAAGFGEIGNSLNPDDRRDGESWYFQQRYGLTDRLTLEAAFQQADDQDDLLLGSTLALGEHYLVNVSTLTREGDTNAQLDIDRFGSDWQLTLNSRSDRIGTDNENHSLRFRRQTNPNFIWGLTGRYSDNGTEVSQFIKPGASWRPMEGLWLNTWPNASGRYQTDVHYRANNSWRVDASYEMESIVLEAEYFDGSNMEYYLAFNQDPGLANLYETGARWQAGGFQKNSTIRVGALSDTRGEWGAFVNWERTLFPGVLFEMLFSDRPSRRDDLRSEWVVNAELTLDFGFNGRRFVPRGSFYSNLTKGSLSGNINVAGTDDCSIDRVSILIDGYPRIVESDQCSYIVENLTPGIHRVRLDSETLPLELAPEDVSYWAEIAMSAVTRVDFDIAPEYGASGRVTDDNGEGIASAPIEVYRLPDMQLLYRARTDQFGYYRADQLKPAEYLIRAYQAEGEGVVGEVTFLITDDYLFDQNVLETSQVIDQCEQPGGNWPSYVISLCNFGL